MPADRERERAMQQAAGRTCGKWQGRDVSENREGFESLRRVSGHLITVADLYRTTLWGPTPNQDAGSAVERMMADDYDVAPILESPMHRYVTRQELEAVPKETPVTSLSRTISAGDLVTSRLPLAQALALLTERPWFFVLDGHDVDALLTIADLQLPPVSLVVFGFVLSVEVGLDAYIDLLLGDSWEGLLTAEKTSRLTAIFEERRRRNVQITRRACLDLDGRLRILCKSVELREAIGVSRSRVERDGEDLKRLRDTLAHGGSLVDVEGDARAGLAVALKASEFADQIWAGLSSTQPAGHTKNAAH